MMGEDNIDDEINRMGYITCRPRRIEPCYYRINDGTGAVLRVLIGISHLAPDAGGARGYHVEQSVSSTVFVPAENRTPEKFVPYSPGELASAIAVRDVEYEVLREEFSVYLLSDGTSVSVKAAMGQIDRTEFVTPYGEPIYLVNPVPVVKMRREEGAPPPC